MGKQIAISILDAPHYELPNTLDYLRSINITHLHIDIGDTSFIPTITLGMPLAIWITKQNFICDFHFMIADPLSLIMQYEEYLHNCFITIHYEIKNYLQTINYLIRKRDENKWRIGVAIKPETNVEIEEDIDRVLIMTVEPGYGGQELKIDCIKKMRLYKKEIGVDGGINEENIKLVKDASYFVIGSYFFKSRSKEKCIEKLYSIIKD